MKKIKIVNKFKFTIFIFLILFLIAIFFLLLYKIIDFKKNNDKTILRGEQKVTTTIKSETDQPEDQKKQQNSNISYIEYNNQRYAYSIVFPDNWYMDNDSSEAMLERSTVDESGSVSAGGQTFWSNYKDINAFTPEQKPDDFHLLGLTVYETKDMSEKDLMLLLGFSAEIAAAPREFKGNETAGHEYVMINEDQKNPVVAIVFAKDNKFYVLNLGFINGDAVAATDMENIAKTLKLK